MDVTCKDMLLAWSAEITCNPNSENVIKKRVAHLHNDHISPDKGEWISELRNVS